MERKVLVEVSARHVHLSPSALEILFGTGYQLTVKKPLSQPGQYAAEERVTVVGPKKEIAGISILGPVRKDSQVELSLTDARSIGLVAPIRESGDIKTSAPCRIVGPKGEITMIEGV
ncbi:MAG: PduL/EutD family phosphate acyltransferase, partial [bacterium]